MSSGYRVFINENTHKLVEAAPGSGCLSQKGGPAHTSVDVRLVDASRLNKVPAWTYILAEIAAEIVLVITSNKGFTQILAW